MANGILAHGKWHSCSRQMAFLLSDRLFESLLSRYLSRYEKKRKKICCIQKFFLPLHPQKGKGPVA